MEGSEYVCEDALRTIWQRLTDWVIAEIQPDGELSAFLNIHAPNWSRVGRVTVHLAENKGDTEFPFAFMATYAAGLNKSGELRRLPLGGALKEFADAGKKAELLRILAPLHAASKQSELIEDLVSTGDVFHPLVWTPEEAYAFLREIPLYEECGLLARVPNWWRKRIRPKVQVTLGAKKGAPLGIRALLDFKLSVALQGDPLTDDEMDALLDHAGGLILLRGEWIEVDRDQLQQALAHWQRVEQHVQANGLSFADGMRLLAGASPGMQDQVAFAEHAAWTQVQASETLQQTLDTLRSPEGLGGPAPATLQGTLRHYQLDGLNWLWLCAQLGVGSCLADDMGLGKTIQVLSVLLRHQSETPEKDRKPALLVVPASLIGNWKDEAQQFAPSLRVTIVHRSERSSAEMDELAGDPYGQLKKIDVVITTYSMVTRLDWLSETTWSWVVLDEAQAIKNPAAQQTQAIKKLLGTARIAITGTPVENRLGDLWSIFDFINPGLLGNAARFREFANALEEKDPPDYSPLRNLISPYILRRMKTDPQIVPDLPDKTEMPTYCGLAKPQVLLYQQTVALLKESLADKEVDDIQRKGLVLSSLMRLKQICNHPAQLLGDGNFAPADSGKFGRLKSLCGEIAARGEKVLVFTQFKEMVAPIAEFLAIPFDQQGLILHGGTAVGKRKDLVAAFQSENGPPFFVLSIKAGGTGLNLTAASHVIHFDRWWNPAVENQATDRAFRIGQKKNVLVHTFITRGTVEEKIDAIIREKQGLSDALLEGSAENSLTELSNPEILAMISLDIERART
jgi:non-specific serine/threonine protein kinase